MDLGAGVLFHDLRIQDAQPPDHPGEVVYGVVGMLGYLTIGEGTADLVAYAPVMVLVELRPGGPGIAGVSEQVDLVGFVEEYARLVLYRHPEISSENALWQKVQEYADAGIEEIYTMMVLQNKPFNIDSLLSTDE